MRSVVFEQGSELTEIGDKAFCGCKSLRSICLPDKLRKIGNGTFSETGLTEVQIPAGVQNIEWNAFQECKSLKKVTFAAGSQLREIGQGAFCSTGLTEIMISANV